MKKLLLCIFLSLSYTGFSQLLLDDTLTPSQLVQQVLVDQSVAPVNITFNNQPGNTVKIQVAQFSTGAVPTGLGLEQGLILATAGTDVALGPNNSGSSSTFAFGGSYVDADLVLIPGAQYLESSSVLEFDFVATGSELNFDYVFASEEYPEFSNSDYNDVFGFFLSGPGLSGPYTNNAENIAIIPNTTTEMTINNLNNGTANAGPCEYCEFYISNGVGQTPELNPYIEYDGFTTTIRAKAALQCGETYHIKLAIGNVGDNNYDSAVFIKNFNVQQKLELLETNNLPENTNVCFGEEISIFSGVPAADNVFVWTKDGDPISESTPSITVNSGGVYALNIFTAAGCSFAYDDILIGYRPEVAAVDPPDINMCAVFSNSYTFDTINQDSAILANLVSGDHSVTYYNSSLADALSGSSNGIIASSNLDNYTITTAAAEIWVRIVETAPTLYGCSTVKAFNINAYGIQTGEISYPGDLFCLDLDTAQSPHSTASEGGMYTAVPTGLSIDNLSGAILPSASQPGNYTIVYNVPATGSCPPYATPPVSITINSSLPNLPQVTTPVLYCQNEPADALDATGDYLLWYDDQADISGSTTSPLPNTANVGSTLYYVSQTTAGCESPRAAITVTVSPVPDSPIVTPVVNFCENEIVTPLTATGLNLLWYDNGWDTTATGSAVAPLPDTSVQGSTVFYVSQTVNNCESAKVAITVNVVAPTAIPQVENAVYCLNDTPQQLIATGSNLLWYTTPVGGMGEAQAPIPDTTLAGTFLFYVTQNTVGCESQRAPITVTVNDLPIPPVANSPVSYCLDEAASPLEANGTNLLWYTAAVGGNPSNITPTPQTHTPGNTIYYVSQQLNNCESERTPITVQVHAPLSLSLPQDGRLCDNFSATVYRSYVIETGLDSNDYTFQWFDLNSGTPELIAAAVTDSFEVFNPGNFGVVATNSTTGCPSAMATTNVLPLYPPEDITITTSNYFDAPSSVSIAVFPIGDYEYQLDGLSFQSSPDFQNILFGSHTITVRDVNHCGSITKPFFMVNYPKYFTPNGDGYNDTWNIYDLQQQPNCKIYIFDRYGKLIKQLFTAGAGWDGTYNGSMLPSTDYWFVIYYDENGTAKTFRSHFSLKR